MKTIILCIIFAVSGVFVPVIYTWVSESSILSIRTIHIKTGKSAKAEELQLYLSEFIGQPLYGIDLKLVQKAAQRHPWVAGAIVRRQPPGELEIEIIERLPVALIKRDKLLVVDSLGTVFKTAENETELSLPLVAHSADVEILLTHAQAKQPGGLILEVQPHGANQNKVIFASGLEAIVGHEHSLDQWQKLVRVFKSLGEKQNTLAYVYLDDTPKRSQIAVRFKKG